MPALVAGIHVSLAGSQIKDVDGRDEPGHDVERNAMKFPRRQFLRLAAGAAALPAASRLAWAQAYPTRPVRIIVAAAPGGANDIVARFMATWLSERLGQFVVENRPGGSNNIGTEAVVRAPPDGYTLLLVDTTAAINATLYDKLNFVFLRDIAPIGGILRLPYVLVAHPSVPANTVPELIAYAKANPGKLIWGRSATEVCPMWPANCSR